jgi:hypothetical protein
MVDYTDKQNVMLKAVKHLYRSSNAILMDYYCGKDASLPSA